MKKFLSILLAIVIALSYCPNLFAFFNDDFGIACLEVGEETVNYAVNVLNKHLHALRQVNEFDDLSNDYYLGEPFTIFNVTSNTNSTCFPVLSNNNIKGILEVTENDGEFNSSFSVSFSKELEDFLKSGVMKNFVLITDGVNLQAFDGNNSVQIFKLYDDGKDNIEDLSSKFNESFATLSYKSPVNELNNVINELKYSNDIKPTGVDGPRAYKTLNVRGVRQGNHDWCWAATCAAIINYLTDNHVSAFNVAYYIYPVNTNRGAGWPEIKKAYNYWELYPYQTGVISFQRIMDNINDYKPIHLRLGYIDDNGHHHGHSVGLIGYEDWSGSYGGYNDRILIILEPNGGIHRSVTLNYNDNFSYNLGSKDVFSWERTIEF